MHHLEQIIILSHFNLECWIFSPLICREVSRQRNFTQKLKDQAAQKVCLHWQRSAVDCRMGRQTAVVEDQWSARGELPVPATHNYRWYCHFHFPKLCFFFQPTNNQRRCCTQLLFSPYLTSIDDIVTLTWWNFSRLQKLTMIFSMSLSLPTTISNTFTFTLCSFNFLAATVYYCIIQKAYHSCSSTIYHRDHHIVIIIEYHKKVSSNKFSIKILFSDTIAVFPSFKIQLNWVVFVLLIL